MATDICEICGQSTRGQPTTLVNVMGGYGVAHTSCYDNTSSFCSCGRAEIEHGECDNMNCRDCGQLVDCGHICEE